MNTVSQNPNRDELLSAYVDGQLAGDELARVEALLASQPSAQQQVDALRRQRAMLAELPKVGAPAGFAERVISQIEAEATHEPGNPVKPKTQFRLPYGRSPRSWAWAAVAVAAALLLTVALPEGDREGVEVAKNDAAGQVEEGGKAGGGEEVESVEEDEGVEESALPSLAATPKASAQAPPMERRMDRRGAFADAAPAPAMENSAPAIESAPQAATDDLVDPMPTQLLVRVSLRPEAYRDNLVDRLLVEQGVAIEPAADDDVRADADDASDANESDMLVVEASAAQLSRTLDALRSDRENCLALEVEPAPLAGRTASASRWLAFSRASTNEPEAPTRSNGAAESEGLAESEGIAEIEASAEPSRSAGRAYRTRSAELRVRSLPRRPAAKAAEGPLAPPSPDSSTPVRALLIIEPAR